MAYYIDLFSPDTYERFSDSNRDVSGFNARLRNAASNVHPGDIFVCYVTKLSRWAGLLEVVSDAYEDHYPIFVDEEDPYFIRFKVRVVVWLEKDKAIPIKEPEIWDTLSFTRDRQGQWSGKFRSSLNELSDDDGKFLEEKLIEQSSLLKTYEVSETDYQKLKGHKIRRFDKEVAVSVPTDSKLETEIIEPTEVRDSTRVQALLAKIGDTMGLTIWVPRADRNRVSQDLGNETPSFLEKLPLNYDDTTLKTIENIDVLWLKGRAIVRAFEVEHTTSIYSGILRMADLLALQPNMNIKLHLVAPESRRDKVFQEIQRPVFSLLDPDPLSDRCSYLSYDSIERISNLDHLNRLSDEVIEDYAEDPE